MIALANAILPAGPNGGDAAVALAGLGALSKSRTPVNAEQAAKAAKDFEAMFISQMMEPMFGDSVGSDSFGSQDTDEIYKGMMMNEYGKQITKAGGIGIADYVKRELLKTQEVSQ